MYRMHASDVCVAMRSVLVVVASAAAVVLFLGVSAAAVILVVVVTAAAAVVVAAVDCVAMRGVALGSPDDAVGMAGDEAKDAGVGCANKQRQDVMGHRHLLLRLRPGLSRPCACRRARLRHAQRRGHYCCGIGEGRRRFRGEVVGR